LDVIIVRGGTTVAFLSVLMFPFSLFPAAILIGFDASGHIAEETRNARQVIFCLVHEGGRYSAYSRISCLTSVVAARGIFSGAVATGIGGFIATILFLFCTPDLDTLFSLDAPQPFVQIFALSLGKGGAVFMTIVASLNLIIVRWFTSVALYVPSDLISGAT
jgi:translation initiation factor 5B